MKRYKIILNAEITNPNKPFPAGGDYAHLNRLEGIVKRLTSDLSWMGPDEARITLDKVLDKSEIAESPAKDDPNTSVVTLTASFLQTYAEYLRHISEQTGKTHVLELRILLSSQSKTFPGLAIVEKKDEF